MPVIFGEGVISTDGNEIGGSFSPDGREFYFIKAPAATTQPVFSMICLSRLVGEHWTKPVILNFSGWYLNTPPQVAPDGKRIYFASTRPLPDVSGPGFWIWYVDRQSDGYSDPKPLLAPINSDKTRLNFDPSLAADGTLYFASVRDETGLVRIFRSKLVNGAYQDPEALGPEINFAEANISQPYISPDQRFLLFGAQRAHAHPLHRLPGELVAGGNPYPRTELYISENKSGKWTPARHLEHAINSSAEDEYPFLSPDGKRLFFSSERSDFTVPLTHSISYQELDDKTKTIYNGLANVYSITVEALELSQ